MHKKTYLKLSIAICILCLAGVSCNSGPDLYKISVTNNSELARSSETIKIAMNDIPELSYSSGNEICVKDESGKRILSQLIDENSGSGSAYLIFQSNFEAKETKHFTLSVSDENPTMPEVSISTFCRFVPERMDDFAWENDKVAFRTYGPSIQKAQENGDPGGLISSGIDCWLKRVEYPIIDKWYKKEEMGGSYHQDDGEGLDNYNVGTTRGCGGTAIIENGKYVLSENYSKWEIITNGPIRSIFEFEYATYQVGSKSVSEKKRFTIDLGSNMFHCEVQYDSSELIQQVGIGIAHHNSNGDINPNIEKKFMTYWETLGDTHLATAIILDSKATVKTNSDAKNNWLNVDITANSFSYWAGFGWKKAGQFSSFTEWNNYISSFSAMQDAPLSVEIRLP